MRLKNTLLSLVFLFQSLIVNTQTINENYFPEIDNWKISNHRIYTPHNLYNAINGAAELYLKYNFAEMQRVDYLQDTNYITVELYKHHNPIDAFGVYSRERPFQEELYFPIGVQGYKENDYIHFIAARFYIKIRVLNVNEGSEEAMNKIAQMQAKALNNDVKFPNVFAWFPEKGRQVNTEKYYSGDILGYKFLHSSFEVTYRINDRQFTAFILKGDSVEDANEMLQNYFNYFELSFEKSHDNFYRLEDKYNGLITILKKSNWLICTRGNISFEESRLFLTEVSNNLK